MQNVNSTVHGAGSRELALNDEILNHAREQGDPVADEVVARLLSDRRFDEIERLMALIVENDDGIPSGLPDYLVEYFETTATPLIQVPDLEAGERFFANFGPELCLILGCYSLPASYAAAKGVAVLHETAFLSRQPNRRIAETGQMIIDVMSPGGLGRNGKGIRSAQKVRLYHAAIRHRILAKGWNVESLGVPINQEDLLGTLMVFSWIGLDGLHKMGIHGSAEEEQAYLDAWRVVGSIMGVRLDLMPTTVAQAQATTTLIQDRQIAPSAAGVEMAAALLGMFDANFPFRGGRTIGASMMRTFLPRYAADYLQIPRHALMDWLMRRVLREIGELDQRFKSGPIRRAFFRSFGLAMIRWFDMVDLNGKRTTFRVPDDLRKRWYPNEDPSFWTLLWRQLISGRLPV
jgi:hypothetical protein